MQNIFPVTTLKEEFKRISPTILRGRVLEIVGPTVRVAISGAAVNDFVTIRRRSGLEPVVARVLSFDRYTALLGPLSEFDDITPGSEVEVVSNVLDNRLSFHLLGTAVNCLGRNIKEFKFRTPSESSRHPLEHKRKIPLGARPLKRVSPFERKRVLEPLETGIRSIDTLLTVGIGQRLAIFAEPGVGKTTLLGALARNAQTDVNVIALIGERSREVLDLIYETLDEETRARSVVVVSTSDEPAAARVQAANTAMSIAEYFAHHGLKVLFQCDSLTRLVRAQRELGLSIGEAPVRQGYPPSVFAELPRLIERAGAFESGSITAFFSVLRSSDLVEDPIVEEVKGLTDGHIVLSRQLAERGHHPAIDILQSLSRLHSRLVDEKIQNSARLLRRDLARLAADRDLIALGGTADPELSAALKREPVINSFLQQDLLRRISAKDSIAELVRVTN